MDIWNMAARSRILYIKINKLPATAHFPLECQFQSKQTNSVGCMNTELPPKGTAPDKGIG